MKLFTTEEIRAIDRYTIENEGVSSLELIERVAEGITDEVSARWRPNKPTIVFCGPGNNGADGLAAARLLSERGFRPEVYLFNIGGDKLSDDCIAERNRLISEVADVNFVEVTSRFNMPQITGNHLVIDALFGSGLREELQGGFKSLVHYINDENATVVSVDVPSGMFGDWNPHIVNRNIIHATLTLAIQFPRISFFFAENAELIGEWKVLDIGLSEKAINQSKASFCLLDRRIVHRQLTPRNDFASKADFGSGLLYAGSFGMMGAAVLAARGALRAGIGKLTVNAPKRGYEIMQTAVPEAMYQHNRGEFNIVDMHPDREYSAIALGPGMGTNELTVKALDDFLSLYGKPLILDADALNCIALKPSLLNKVPVLSILTPHAGEFDRIFGPQPSGEARLRKAMEMAKHYDIIIVLKGRYTAIVRPDGRVYFNSTGSPALATPGSGDVLTGVILGLLSQPDITSEFAALIGAYIHGLAGEMAAETHGEYGVAASDIAQNIGRAIAEVMK